MFWKWLPQRKGTAALPPDSREMLPDAGPPAADLEAFGAVARANHIAYIPAKPWSRVPGVGTSNLVYAPDFLLSPPQWIGGSGLLRSPNSIAIASKPAVIVHPKTTLEGVGGIVAGQLVHQPLLEVDIQNGLSGVGAE